MGGYNHPTAVVLMFGKQLAALTVWPGLDLVPSFTTVRPGSPHHQHWQHHLASEFCVTHDRGFILSALSQAP